MRFSRALLALAFAFSPACRTHAESCKRLDLRALIGQAQRWEQSVIVLEYAPVSGVPAAHMTRGLRTVTRAALDLELAGGPKIQLRPRSTASAPSEDGRSTLTWNKQPGRCNPSYSRPCLPGHMLGVTYLYTVPDSTERRIVEGDLILDVQLLDQPEQLLTVARHELGHLLGLRDMPDENHADSVMHFPAHRHFRSRLQQCDVQALKVLYSKPTPPQA